VIFPWFGTGYGVAFETVYPQYQSESERNEKSSTTHITTTLRALAEAGFGSAGILILTSLVTFSFAFGVSENLNERLKTREGVWNANWERTLGFAVGLLVHSLVDFKPAHGPANCRVVSQFCAALASMPLG